jgi:sugar phosphate isomerase/epimerase
VQLALCNEVLQPMPFARQCEYAARLGYDGLEVAPFTLADEPHRMTTAHRASVRRAAEDAGIRVLGLHWLLFAPQGLSITSGDAAVRARTQDVMLRLIDLCADLGGTYLVHGSAAQRRVPDGETRAVALARATECWARAGARAAPLGLHYCIEPLAPAESDLINTVAEAMAVVESVASPGLYAMIDCSAASRAEAESIPALLDRWLPTGRIAHVQVNDRNRRGRGEGDVAFAPILAALRRNGYDAVVAVEPFACEPDGPATAARAVGYLRGILEALP